MTEAQIKHMVDRFLAWRLPENFNPDCGISFDRSTLNAHTPYPTKYEPTGTNLFDAEQATAMVCHMLESLPSPLSDTVLREALASCESWIDRWTTHIGSCAGWNKCTCGRTAILFDARAALSVAPSPAAGNAKKLIEEADPNVGRALKDAPIFNDYGDLSKEFQKPLQELEAFIGELDGHDLCTRTEGNTFLDDGTIDGTEAVIAFNSIVTVIRALKSAAPTQTDGWQRDAALEEAAKIVEGDVYKEHYRKWPSVSSEEDQRARDDLRQHWNAFCDADSIPFDHDDFLDRLEKHGLIELRGVTDDDLNDAFAAERGIERGGSLWDLTEKGRAALSTTQAGKEGEANTKGHLREPDRVRWPDNAQPPSVMAGAEALVAWIDFAENGNIRFWTNDQNRADDEKKAGRHLRGFTLPELVALTALRSQPAMGLSEEELAEIIYDNVSCNSNHSITGVYDASRAIIDRLTGRSGGAMTVRILKGYCREVLKTLPDESVHCVVTSPPYWGLRDYGVAGQIGLEDSWIDFIEQMVGVFSEVRRVLRQDGTCWINMGDTYAGGGRGGNPSHSPHVKQRTNLGSLSVRNQRMALGRLKPKDLIGMPWRLAFALQADGWWLRRDIIWHKTNPMPESVNDRPTCCHEYLFLMTRSSHYAYDADAILEPISPNTHARLSKDIANQIGSARANGGTKSNGNMKAVGRAPKTVPAGQKIKNNESFAAATSMPVTHRNKRTIWATRTEAFSEAHFATFPPALIEPCIKAGCPLGGTVLDPFGGAGTTGMVADRLGRHAILIELNPKYAAMAERRIKHDGGIFAEVTA
jgi:DNA modification methylase